MYNPIGQRRSVDIQNKLQAVEIFNETERYREERALLIGEMNNLLRFYYGVILPSISQSISGTHACTCTYVVTYIHKDSSSCNSIYMHAVLHSQTILPVGV